MKTADASRPSDGAAPASDSVITPSVDVVIVNWNGGEEVVAAARSATRFGGRTIVADNGSTDGSVDLIRHAVPEATVVLMGSDTGFSHACNAGVAAGTGKYVFLLGPDAEIMHGSIADLECGFAWHPNTMIVAPQVLGPSGESVRSARRFPTTFTLALLQFKLHKIARWIPPLREYFMLDFETDRPALVDQPIGAAIAMRRMDWDRLGGLDDGYFLWFEDVDLCRRVADAGGRSVHWPTVQVRHVGGTSFRHTRHVQLQLIWNASLLRYARRHLGRGASVVLATTVPVAILLSFLVDLAEKLRGDQSRSDRAPDEATYSPGESRRK